MMKTLAALCAAVLLCCAGLTGLAEGTEEGQTGMKMWIGETCVEVEWENNEAVEALKGLAAGGLTVTMSMYGGFEQVGPLGQSLPNDDERIVTVSGDIVLYAGDQIVVFYGSNTWAYTRLGHIIDKTPEEMRDLLGRGDVIITISAE